MYQAPGWSRNGRHSTARGITDYRNRIARRWRRNAVGLLAGWWWGRAHWRGGGWRFRDLVARPGGRAERGVSTAWCFLVGRIGRSDSWCSPPGPRTAARLVPPGPVPTRPRCQGPGSRPPATGIAQPAPPRPTTASIWTLAPFQRECHPEAGAGRVGAREPFAVDPVHGVEVVLLDELDAGVSHVRQRSPDLGEDALQVGDRLVELVLEAPLHEVACDRITSDLTCYPGPGSRRCGYWGYGPRGSGAWWLVTAMSAEDMLLLLEGGRRRSTTLPSLRGGSPQEMQGGGYAIRNGPINRHDHFGDPGRHQVTQPLGQRLGRSGGPHGQPRR